MLGWFSDEASRASRRNRSSISAVPASSGDLVTREELRTHIWGGDTHVDFDRGLAYCIGQLRSALGDTADNPRFVQTQPRRGFTFIAPIEIDEAGPKGPARQPDAQIPN